MPRPEKHVQTCRACGGKGWFNHKSKSGYGYISVICRTCHGKGIVVV